MTNIVKSKNKTSRRLGTKLWDTHKEVKNYRPGQHGQNSMMKVSDYGKHLVAKQRIKFHYGRVGEKQFRNIFALAQKMKGNTAENFVGLLERRIDCVVYRLNLAPTIFAARQLVSHGHVKVNGKRVTIGSQRLNEGDVIELKDTSKQVPTIIEAVGSLKRTVPTHLTLDANSMHGIFVRVPKIDEIPYPFDPEINIVVEFLKRY